MALASAVVLATGAVLVITLRNAYPHSIPDVPSVEITSEIVSPLAMPCPDSESWKVISIPDARYTLAARQRGINGKVELFGYFEFNGNVAVDKVVSGLGLGLDQAALKAARQIKFTPTIQCSRFLSEPVRIVYEFPSGKGTAIHL